MNHEMKQLREEWKTAEQEEGIKGNGKLEKDKQQQVQGIGDNDGAWS